jgi:hypothetical protein
VWRVLYSSLSGRNSVRSMDRSPPDDPSRVENSFPAFDSRRTWWHSVSSGSCHSAATAHGSPSGGLVSGAALS